jgi:hypothetical protein
MFNAITCHAGGTQTEQSAQMAVPEQAFGPHKRKVKNGLHR